MIAWHVSTSWEESIKVIRGKPFYVNKLSLVTGNNDMMNPLVSEFITSSLQIHRFIIASASQNLFDAKAEPTTLALP